MKEKIESMFPEELLRYWVGLAPGAFHVSALSRDLTTQQIYIDRLERLVEQGHIDHYREKRGWYIPKQKELREMDYKKANDEPVDIWLPFNLSDKVEIYPSSVIIIAGAPNSGKTAVLLNMIRENQPKGWDQHYFNSEMSAEELKKRLKKFHDITLDQWEFKAYHRADRFADVVFPGPNQINYVDFLEVHDEFYVIGGRIKEIHDRLDGGIAVIAIQKNPGQDTGLGGYRSMEVSRLSLALDYGRVKITKAKNFATDQNPNGWVKPFKLIDGCRIIDRHGWSQEVKS